MVAMTTCTGFRYLINDDAPDEGTDVHHDGPCPVHQVDELGRPCDAEPQTAGVRHYVFVGTP